MKINVPARHRLMRFAGGTLVLGLLFGGVQLQNADQAFAVGQCSSNYVWALEGRNSNAITVQVPVYADIPTGSNPGGNHTIGCAMWQGMPTDLTGHHGAGALVLQETLNLCYGENLAEDGIFGYRTAQALRRAQADENIEVDGIYGRQSATHLRHRKWHRSNGCRRLEVPIQTTSHGIVRRFN